MTTDNKKKWSFMQGITTHNPVFASGLAIAPAVFAGSTLSGALTYAAFFSAVTFTALFFSSLLPRRIPYALLFADLIPIYQKYGIEWGETQVEMEFYLKTLRKNIRILVI